MCLAKTNSVSKSWRSYSACIYYIESSQLYLVNQLDKIYDKKIKTLIITLSDFIPFYPNKSCFTLFKVYHFL